MDKKEINAYLRQVKRNCPSPFRRTLQKELRGDLLDYTQEHPGATMGELTEHFGAPETFAYEYIIAMDDAKRQRLLRRSRWVIGCLLAGLILSVLLMVGAEMKIYYDNHRPLQLWEGSLIPDDDEWMKHE